MLARIYNFIERFGNYLFQARYSDFKNNFDEKERKFREVMNEGSKSLENKTNCN